jgi:hypothetical protein
MLKDFGTSLYSITVTADSLAAPDWAAEKEARTEFMGAASNYLMAAAPLVQQSPAIGTLLIQLLQWGAAGFKGSKTIEGVLDQAAKQLEQAAQNPPPPPPPSPEDKKDEAGAAKALADAEKAKQEAIKIAMENQAASTVLGIPVPGAAGANGAAGPPQGPPGMQPPPMQPPPQGMPPGGGPPMM